MSSGPSTVYADTDHSPEQAADVGRVLECLEDADCRAIIDATGERALSACEVAETCDLATSTAYRKLGLLVDAGLVDEGTRLRRSGKHASEYRRAADSVVVALDGDAVTVRVQGRDADE